MRHNYKKPILITVVVLTVGVFLFVLASVFFDEAVLVRKGTLYRVPVAEKVVALTFDDGPSPQWTPQILGALKSVKVKATFFMLGNHVEKYPEIAKLVAEGGHEIGNHTYDHHVLLYYKTEELRKEIKEAERVIKQITGAETKYFRPPKAWLNPQEKQEIKEMGYKIILWTINSKDWVTFDDKYIVRYIVKHVSPGDIILFHDSGGVLGTEGGNRKETVKAIPRLVEKLRERGYRFVTISELLKIGEKDTHER